MLSSSSAVCPLISTRNCEELMACGRLAQGETLEMIWFNSLPLLKRIETEWMRVLPRRQGTKKKTHVLS
jgi:hypothetical protein